MAFSASMSAVVAKSPADFSKRVSDAPYWERTTAAPAAAASMTRSRSLIDMHAP
ncbi:hypothetical protein B0E53_00644 [Micromonospora sp. MH33]|nr:hypothetical protein B0E53_00644 [Micromonospora sp. MH33]